MAKKLIGWIKLYRSIWETPIWESKEPFDRRSAWIDLMLMANHEDKDMVLPTGVIKVHVGQLFTSVRHLAKRWNWSEGRVRRYLNTLVVLEMIYVDGTPNGSLLTLINYGKYQIQRHT